jgi:hypothetical protein
VPPAGVVTQAPWLARVDALFDRHHCSSLYLDVGTNVGVQLHKLFEPAKFGGAPVLQVFDSLFGATDRGCRTCAIGIEPNPRHTQRLDQLESALSAAGAGVIVLRGAAGTSESHVTLSLPRKGAHEGVDLDARVGDTTARSQRQSPRELIVTVPQFDLAAIIRHVRGRLPKHAPLLMKLDVEGQEYRILPELLLSQSFCLVTKVYKNPKPKPNPRPQLNPNPNPHPNPTPSHGQAYSKGLPRVAPQHLLDAAAFSEAAACRCRAARAVDISTQTLT